MSPVPRRDKSFEEFFQDPEEQSKVSDAELERMMAASSPAGREERGAEHLRSGDVVEGVVVRADDQEVIVELDSKTHGCIERAEFGDEPPPPAGTRVKAHYQRFDRDRELVVLSVGEIRKDLFWDEARPGQSYEGVVTAATKGGLTIGIKGARAFMPLGQIDVAPVDAASLASWVGRKVTCEVTSVDRGRRELIVSRASLLRRDQQKNRAHALQQFRVGQELVGRVVRVNEHGAFIDLGGVDGLLHASKFQRRSKGEKPARAPQPGDTLNVRVISLDTTSQRIGLELPERPDDVWSTLGADDYRPGESIVGVVARLTDDEVFVTLEQGIEGVLRAGAGHPARAGLRPGVMLRAVVRTVDPARRRIELEAAGE